jgi:hypothetical protein
MLDPKVSALLRLKRHEQPPPGYFDQLLHDVHRRQRAELLRRPLWKIAAERMQVFFSEHSMGNLSYAGAMAAVLVFGVAAIGLMTPGEIRPANNLADNGSAPAAPVAAGTNRMIVLGPQNTLTAARLTSQREPAGPQIAAPRYVMDARPVSYERTSSY